MPKAIEFWYEFASTYSYPAAMRIEELAAAKGVQVAWKPFLLGVIFRNMGFESTPFNEQPVKGAYMWRDMERLCEKFGLGFQRPDPFPQSSMFGTRIASALPDDGTRAAFSRALYARQFADGMGLSDQEGIAALLADLGHDPAKVIETALSQDNKDALRARTQQAVELGIFGAPMIRTSDGEMFWGHDRLEDAVQWAVDH